MKEPRPLSKASSDSTIASHASPRSSKPSVCWYLSATSNGCSSPHARVFRNSSAKAASPRRRQRSRAAPFRRPPNSPRVSVSLHGGCVGHVGGPGSGGLRA
eukprot:1747780-Pyramimonas_sp.AAC.1